jgi:hypothetical protein
MQAVAGFDGLPAWSDRSYPTDRNATFAVVGAALTDTTSPPPDYPATIDEEVQLAKGLGVQLLRYDIQLELLESSEGRASIAYAIHAAHQAGLGVVLSPFGRHSWGGQAVGAAELNLTLQNETAWLASEFRPDWIFPFYEPNGQLQSDLGHPLTTSAWMPMIAAASREVKELSPRTQVLIEVADGPQGLDLVRAVARIPDVDALGFDLYPTSASRISEANAYAAAWHSASTKPFWISEAGLGSIVFGEEAQANFYGAAVANAFGPWNASGFCAWGLQDNVGEGLGPHLLNSLGLVAFDGREKPSYDAYRLAIASVRGTAS